MKNIEYLEQFFKKHNLSGKITVRYSGQKIDDYMSEIIFDNGDHISINDIIFDIDSGLHPDVVKQWMESKREKDISLINWMKTDYHYVPKLDKQPIEAYKMELESIVEDIKQSADKIFQMQEDE